MEDYTPVVLLETPFSPSNGFTSAQNIMYARHCMRHMLQLGESPVALHLLYTQCLDDNILVQRELGLKRSEAFYPLVDYIAVYTDFGVTRGMERGIEHAKAHNIGIAYRRVLQSSFKGSSSAQEIWGQVRSLLSGRGHSGVWADSDLVEYTRE